MWEQPRSSSQTPPHLPAVMKLLLRLSYLAFLLSLLLSLSTSLPTEQHEDHQQAENQFQNEDLQQVSEKRSKFLNRNYLRYLKNKMAPFFPPTRKQNDRYKVSCSHPQQIFRTEIFCLLEKLWQNGCQWVLRRHIFQWIWWLLDG